MDRKRPKFPWITDAVIPLLVTGCGVMGLHLPYMAGPALIALGLLILVFRFVAWVNSWPDAPKRHDVPLHEVITYIAGKSVWGDQMLADGHDYNEWQVRAEDELAMALAHGQLSAWGTYRRGYASGDQAPTRIPQERWREIGRHYTDWTSFEPPTDVGIRETKETWRDVRFSREEIEAVWPERSLWANLLRPSPVKRSGLDKAIVAKKRVRAKTGLFIEPGQGWRIRRK